MLGRHNVHRPVRPLASIGRLYSSGSWHDDKIKDYLVYAWSFLRLIACSYVAQWQHTDIVAGMKTKAFHMSFIPVKQMQVFYITNSNDIFL